MLATVEHFRVPAVVCINKHDINSLCAAEIEQFCVSQGIGLVGRIPFDTEVTTAMVNGKTITEYCHGAVSRELSSAWRRVEAALGG
jgi:MinD superfamily P-loop ATPase